MKVQAAGEAAEAEDVMPKPTKSPARPPKSELLFAAGFKTMKDAAACLRAVVQDLAADRISATAANEMTAATGRWMRDYEKKVKDGKLWNA